MFKTTHYRAALRFLLIGSFILLLVLRVPSIFEPKWYGDEGIYAAVGHHLRAGGMLYRDAWDNKPPLLYLLYMFFDLFGKYNQVAARVTNLIFSATTSLILFFLTLKVTGKKASAVLAAVLSNLFLATPIFEANIANAENFFILFSCLGILLLWNRERPALFLGGVLFSIAFLIKVPPVFELFAVLFFFLVEAYVDNTLYKDFVSRYWLAILGFLTPLLLTFIYFLLTGTLGQFIYSAFLFGVSYVQEPFVKWLLPSLVPNTIIFRGLLFAFLLGFVFLLRLLVKINSKMFFALVWVIAAFVGATLSSRAYPHYLLQVIPAVSLLVGVSFTSKFYLRNFAMSLLVVFLLFNVFTGWGKLSSVMPSGYYRLFLDKWAGRISQQEFNDCFDPSVNDIAEIKRMLASHYSEIDRVFVFANVPWIYDIANVLSPVRFFSAYHVFWRAWNTERALQDLRKEPPELIIIQDDIGVPEVLNDFVHDYYALSRSWDFYDFYLLCN